MIIDNGTSENPESLEGATGRLFIDLFLTDDQHVTMKQTFLNLITGEEKILKEVNISAEHELMKQVVIDDAGNCLEIFYNPQDSEISILESPLEGLKMLTTFFYDENERLSSIFTQKENGDFTLETKETANWNPII